MTDLGSESHCGSCGDPRLHWSRELGGASALAARIIEAATRLIDHRAVGRAGREPGTRELVIPRTRYIVLYRIDGESIILLAVIHGARRWSRL